MKRITLLLLLLSLVLFACKRNTKGMIIGKWHAVKLENPDMDEFFTKQPAIYRYDRQGPMMTPQISGCMA